MACRLFNLLTALSLLTCAAVAGEWAFNQRSLHGAIVNSPSGFSVFHCEPLGLYLGFGRYLRPPHPRDTELWMHSRAWAVHWRSEVVEHPDRAFTRRLGFGIGWFEAGQPRSPNSRIRYLLIPYWFLVTMTAIPPLAWVNRQWRGHRQALLGLCGNCGYDLRATPGRCPECGHVPAGAAA